MSALDPIRSTLVIAGPGAGKTHSLVNKFLEEIVEVPAHKYVAVITYTNASADDVTKALEKQSAIEKNVFIGTIHSFVNKFIVLPYGHLARRIPLELTFIDEVPFSPGRSNLPAHYALLDQLSSKGVVTHDQSVRIAREILTKEPQIRDAVANRMHAIFVDEYQDVTVSQAAIFQSLKFAKKTKFYFVGDPEQFVYRFMPNAPKTQHTLPIIKLESQKSTITERIKSNHRSTSKIVKLLNAVSMHEQKTDNDEGYDVVFVDVTDVEEIYKQFTTIQHLANCTEGKTFILGEHLSKEKYECLKNLPAINSFGRSGQKLLSDVESLICGICQKNKTELLNGLDMDKLNFRIHSLAVLRIIAEGQAECLPALNDYLQLNFYLDNSDHKLQLMKAMIDKITAKVAETNEETESGVFLSTIRKSKGLEADSVLAIASSESELLRWIETNQSKRMEDKSDQTKMGYVAFSRAKRLLVIACRKTISATTIQKLVALDIKYESSLPVDRLTKELWDKVIEEISAVSTAIGNVLSRATVIATNERVLLRFPYLFYVRVISKDTAMSQFKKVLRDVCGKDFEVDIEHVPSA